MHYTTGGEPNLAYSISQSPKEVLRQQVRVSIVENVPSERYTETDDFLPLQHDTSIQSIVLGSFRFANGSGRSNAVYVLECLSKQQSNALWEKNVTGQNLARYSEAGNHRRVLYVGVTSNLVRRLNQHLNSPGDEGAVFTGQYPPIRILQVGWFRSYERAESAEAIAAQMLRQKFPEDYVAFPG